ncbi:xanthine dehydrogenase family protein molybdopterin-binding subunit [Lentzea roselyniae]|uniref:Xanthine dehydrogenase family protein molybdopterin-binding subunit n=1 Tax=Lentzea roselyniae TaxID=531940 RepID=A0ABP7ANB3_9PSEU
MNPFVRIDPESGRITVTVPVPDTGQGVRTAVALMVAEELKVSVESLTIEQAEGDSDTYGEQISANSNTMQRLHEPIRTAAATVRQLLVEAAAQRWRVPAADCRASDGFVRHGDNRLSYGELAEEAAKLTPSDVVLTPHGEWRVLGNPQIKRVDQDAIVTGKLAYAIDQPADLVAVVARPPWIGATPTGFDDTDVRNAEVVQLDNGFALLARDTHTALKAREALRTTWQGGSPDADSDEWLAALEAALPEGKTPPGDYVEKIYVMPMLAHVPMEPPTATAKASDTEVTVWAPTQAPDQVRKLLEADFAKVRVIPTRAGGAFGRKFEVDFVLEAVQLARHTGRTVKVLWTRDDDMRHDSYRPLSVHRVRATVNDEGLPTWRDHAVSTWPLSSVLEVTSNPQIMQMMANKYPYDVEGEVHFAISPPPIRTGFWRSVYAGQSVYAEEMFLSELDMADNQLERRLKLLTDRRVRKTLEAAAEAHHGEPQAVACHRDYGSAVAVIAETIRDGRTKITAAVDVGPALHPSGVRQQVEGAIMDAVSVVKGARITVKQGKVVQKSFGDYPWARIGDTPEINVVVMASDAPVGGLGELAYPAAAAALGFLSR